MLKPWRNKLARFSARSEAALAVAIAFAVVFGTAALGSAQWLAYGAFLYIPVALAALRGRDFAAFGLLSSAPLHSLLFGFATSAILFPLFAGFYYLSTEGLFGLLPSELGLPWVAGFIGNWGDVFRFALVQLVLVAFAEEYFYRGYLQQKFDEVWKPQWKILGADLGPGWLVATFLFALGHLALELNPARLLTFFPGLWFGWLRAKTGDIYGAVFAHGASNVLIAWLQGQVLN